jgi:hypothetical protein
MVHDVDRQKVGIDLEGPQSGKTFSVKRQKRAEAPGAGRTRNFSFEKKLISTRTGNTRVGNFMDDVADLYIIAWPRSEGSPVYRAALFETASLRDFVLKNYFRIVTINDDTYATNFNREFDQAENYLVTIEKCLTQSRGTQELDTREFFADPQFLKFCRANHVVV